MPILAAVLPGTIFLRFACILFGNLLYNLVDDVKAVLVDYLETLTALEGVIERIWVKPRWNVRRDEVGYKDVVVPVPFRVSDCV